MRGREAQDLVDELQRRVNRAVRRAHVAVTRSRMLEGAHQLVRARGGTLVRRCAWCGRYELGGVWAPGRRLPRFVRGDEERVAGKELTHTICPTCFERQTGGVDAEH